MGSPADIVTADETALAAAAGLLRSGGLVAFPTETVYGLGADARNDAAVARIFDAKDRPRFNPLIVHVANLDEAGALARVNDAAVDLARRFWPGPLSLVLPQRPGAGLSRLVSAGLDTVALRAPAHPLARDLLARFGGPVAAPSANAAGAVSPTAAAHVAESLNGKPDMILDGGACPVGLESTVVDLTGGTPALLRHGAVTLEQLRGAVGKTRDATAPVPGEAPRSPGQTQRHYATAIPIRTDAAEGRAGEATISFGADDLAGGAANRNLSPAGDLVEAAANLFAVLRELDRPEFSGIAVAPIPREGLGRAINDRLRRAAATPRE